MRKISRRELFRTAAVCLGAATLNKLLSGCTPGSESPISTRSEPASLPTRFSPSATSTQSPLSTIEPMTNTPTIQPTLKSIPDLVVVRNGEPEGLVRTALAALGGIERFVFQGANVVIKPNICVSYHTYEYAATTNPWVVGTLVKMCFEAGAASVKVFDYPFGGTAKEAYTKSGIQEQVSANGGEMVTMTGLKYVSTQIPGGVELKKAEVFSDVLKADVLIDVPIAKHHSSARLTLGMKNLMGVVRDRSAFHFNLGQRIADLSTVIKPNLTVIDAVRILVANGPTGGDLNDVRKLDTIIASTDIVAADSYGASLFGKKPEDIPYIKAAAAMGLGRSDLQNLKIDELVVGA